jgi:hypothetical protein
MANRQTGRKRAGIARVSHVLRVGMHFWLTELCNALSKQLPDRSGPNDVGHADSKDGTPGEQSSDASNLESGAKKERAISALLPPPQNTVAERIRQLGRNRMVLRTPAAVLRRARAAAG